ncbi:MAG: phosphotransferase [Anaerolineae bacterium]|nr:phosphotransferase [Anaerolineae bacterium]
MPLPDSFVHTVSLTFEEGAEWLARLPALIAACEARWGLAAQPHFPGLSYNYAAPATLPDGTEIVLKLGVPRHELTTEIEALKLYNSRAMCHLLDADAAMGVLLLERLQPGHMLITVSDDETATRIAADVMRRLWRPLPDQHIFPAVADWIADLAALRTEFDGGTGPFPARLVAMAESLFADLVASSGPPVLLHGDLHHYNILAAEREPWLAIDPKGVAGEPAYEVGALMRNPLNLHEWPNRTAVTARRLDILAEQLDMDRQRLLAWSFAQEILSQWWDYVDTHSLPNLWLAECLAGMLGEGVSR